MRTSSTLLLSGIISGIILSSCEPTPRTAVDKNDKEKQSQEANIEEPTEKEDPAPKAEPTPKDEPAAKEEQAKTAPAIKPAIITDPSRSILTIQVSDQPYNRMTPWEKGKGSKHMLNGIYLGDGKVLSLGMVMKAPSFIEISLPDQSQRISAKRSYHDTELGLSILEPIHEKDQSIFESRSPLSLGEPLKLGDKAEYWYLIEGGIPKSTELQVKSSGLSSAKMPRLHLQSEQTLTSRDSYGLPIIKNGKLAGISEGYNRDSQSLYGINAETIAGILAQRSQESIVPIIGITTVPLDDPVLSRYLNMPEGSQGIYISELTPHGSAEQAGLKKGDVITQIDGMSIDNKGLVKHPLYGAINARSIMRHQRKVGDTLPIQICRNGKLQSIDIPLSRDTESKGLLARNLPDTPPNYIIHGGIVIQELSLDYLQEFKSKSNNLPLQLLQIEDRLKELQAAGYDKLCIISRIIPTPATLGYEKLGFSLIEQVNGQPARNIREIANLLDAATANGLTSIRINKAPYTIYLDRNSVEKSNDSLRRRGIPKLRQLPCSNKESNP